MVCSHHVLRLLLGLLLLSACREPDPVQDASLPVPATSLPSTTEEFTPGDVTAMFRGGPAHLGVYYSLPRMPEWVFEAGGEIHASPVISDNLAYIGDVSGALYAIRLPNGEPRWTFQAPEPISSSAAADGDHLYVGTGASDGSGRGQLYALDRATGTVQWQFAAGPVLSSPATDDRTVYFGDLTGNFYALEKSTGTLRWQFETSRPLYTSPVAGPDNVYFGGDDGYLYALARPTGEVQWQFSVGSPIRSSPAVTGGVVYVGSEEGRVVALDARSGQLLWQHQMAGPVTASPAVTGEQLFIGSQDRHLVALATASGRPIWDFTAGAGIVSSPAVTSDNVFVADLAGRFYVLDRETGELAWSLVAGGPIRSSPAVAGDVVYVGSDDGHLYALRRQGPRVTLAPTPTPLPLAPTLTPLPPVEVAVRTGTAGLPWWNDHLFYEVFVRSFHDSDGDGIGDLQGLISKLDYLNDGDPTTTNDLGVTGLWLMPVAESPSYHGYDVVDYQQVEQDYGTNEDLKQLIAEAHDRGMVVIVDLVMNHTSSQHPWFQDARTPGSAHESWYIWSTDPPSYLSPWGSSVWHSAGRRAYYGIFWSGMPDLNYENGEVTRAMYDVIRFWLTEMEVDGFRLDAIRHLIEAGPVQSNTPATHAWLQNFYRYVHSLVPDVLTVGEIWDTTAQVVPYVGDEVDLAFEFDLASAILDSVNRENSGPVRATQARVLEAYPPGQYATFLTNHDQDRVINQLDDDVAGARTAASILLTSPGVPFIYYGEEIGMRGAKPDERIRTPMQWDGSEAAGFTTGTPWQPLGSGYRRIHVAAQASEPDSLLNHYRQLIHLRHAHPALRVGDLTLVDSRDRAVYSFLRQSESEIVLVLINLSDQPVGDYHLTLDEGPFTATPTATFLMGDGDLTPPIPNAAGGFDDYRPVPTLTPRSTTLIQLVP